MFDEKSEEIGRLLFILDVLLSLLVFLLAYHLRQAILPGDASLIEHLALFPLILVPLSFFLIKLGVYKGLRVISLHSYAWQVCKAFAFSMLILMALLFSLKITFVSRGLIGIYVGLNILVLVAVRASLIWWYFRHSVQKDINYQKVLIIGIGNRAQHLTEVLLRNTEWGINIIGYLDTDAKNIGKEVLNSKVIGSIDQIEDVLTSQVVDEVILAVPRKSLGYMEGIVRVCKEQGVRFRFMADVIGLDVARTQLVEVDGIPLLTCDPVVQDEGDLLVKRLLGLIVVILTMPLTLPLMAIIALAIKLDDGGPVFFIQQRVGLHKRLFPMYKFRSMAVDAEEKLKEIEHLNEAEGPIFKISNDPRITRVGRFLRKTSLDELPQLINVFRGEMSLVGPRPMSTRDVDRFDKGIQRKRFSVRPGLTCLWQISGRSNLSFDEWLELDLKYIDEWSLWLDIKILIQTIPAVIKGEGAV